MENQGKRLLLAVGLALLVVFGWNLLFPPKQEPKKETAPGSVPAEVTPTAPGVAPAPTPTPERAGSAAPGTQAGTGSSAGSAAAPGAPAPTPTPAPSAGAQPPAMQAQVPRPPEQETRLEFPGKFTATFTNYGGALKSWQLSDKRFERDATKGELLPNNADTGSFLVCVLDSQCELTRPEAWTLKASSGNVVTYTYSTPQYDLEKTFTVYPENFLVKLQVKAIAKRDQAAPQRIAVMVYAKQDPKVDAEGSHQVAARVWQSATQRDGTIYHTPMKQVIKAPRWEDNVQWTGFEHPYLLAGYAPQHTDAGRIEKKTWAGLALGETAGASELMRTDILFPATLVRAGSQMTQEVVGYLGPKNYRELDRADAAAGFSTGFQDTIDFGWFGVIGKPLLWLLQKFYALVGNWGIAIIMLTFLVKLATLYWTTKSMRSMKAMAALAPQMKALQEKYKDDRQRLQVETMALYKQHSVNPIAGCLPILLQMPIWIALYRMLSSAGELYQAPFIPGWINDLTDTDPYHILPIVLVVTMFAQARLQPATGDSRQQKMLQYGMPLMFGVMSFFFPSGLTIYIFTNTALSALHSIYMNRYDKKSLALVAQMKKNAEAAAKPAAASGKDAGKGSAKSKPAAEKPVIDVESTETADADDAESPESGAGASSSNQARSNAGRANAKRKKRRR